MHSMAQTHRHTHPHTNGHGDSMTNSAQWGRVGENGTYGENMNFDLVPEFQKVNKLTKILGTKGPGKCTCRCPNIKKRITTNKL